MSNTQQIEESLKSLILDDDREFVAMLSGKWGSGKTYFWKELSTKQELTDSKKSITYISLFGYSSIQSIKNDIVLKLSKAETTKAVFSEVFQSFRTSLSSKDGDESSNLNLSGSLISSALSLIPEKSLKDSIVCFDDFERLSDQVSFKDVLGLISQFKEQKKCKVIMILNEGELSENNQDIFSKNKEKIVDYSFNYQPNQEKLFEAIQQDIKKITWCEHTTIYDFFKKIDLKNIRIMKQALYLLNLFDFIKDYDLDEKVVSELVEIALNLFVFKAYSNYTYSEFEDLKEYTPPDLARKAARAIGSFTEKDFEETRNDKHEKYFWHYSHLSNQLFPNVNNSINKNIIEKYIYDFMDNHTINKDELQSLLKENNQSLSWYDVRNEISELHTRLYTDFTTKNSEITKQLFSLLSEHKDDMHHLFHYDKYKPFIENINKFSPATVTELLEKEIAKNYLNFYSDNSNYDISGPLDTEAGQSSLLISDYDWAHMYIDEYKKKSTKITPEEILPLIENILNRKNLSEGEIFKLNQISAEDYKKQIKENPNLIQPLVKFLKMSDSKDVRNNIINALKSLKKENDDYAWKVNQIIKSVDINLEEDK